MKRTLWMSSLMLLLLCSPSWAGGIGGMVSYWDADQAEDGDGVGVKAELDFAQWDLELRYALLDGYEARGSGQIFALEASPVDLGLAYNFRRGEAANPYLGAGVSYVLFDVVTQGSFPTAGLRPASRVKDEVGPYFVAGVEFRTGNRFVVFAEGIYRDVKAEIQGDDIRTFTEVSVDFAGVGANVGFMLTW